MSLGLFASLDATFTVHTEREFRRHVSNPLTPSAILFTFCLFATLDARQPLAPVPVITTTASKQPESRGRLCTWSARSD